MVFSNDLLIDGHRTGPVTDYGSSMVQWMRHRQPRYKGGPTVELERPSPSYIVDVCSSIQILSRTSVLSLIIIASMTDLPI